MFNCNENKGIQSEVLKDVLNRDERYLAHRNRHSTDDSRDQIIF